MKYLVYLLLLANLGMFAWLYTHQDGYRPSGPAPAALPPSVEPLVMLRERSAFEPGNAPVVAEAEPEAELPAMKPPDAEAVPPPPAMDASASAPTPGVPEEVVPGVAADVAEDAAVKPEETEAAESDAETEPAPPAPPPPICHTIGPFPERGLAEDFMARLTAQEQPPAVRSVQIEEPSGYWVYLPPRPRAEARRIVNELAAKGVDDYFLGREGSISLGIYSDKRIAENRARDIGKLGYQPQLEPRFVNREVYWVDFEERGPDYTSDEQWRALLNAQPELRHEQLACE
jgi:hypothetical protein